MFTDQKALLLFSGGQDSGTCLGWALNRFQLVETVGFDYGQRHKVELDCRQNIRQHIVSIKAEWREKLGEDTILKTGLFEQIGETALTSKIDISVDANGLPNTYVPGRNLIFFTAAAALAWRKGIHHIISGVCETDSSGYPDCRDDSVKAMQVALNLGMNAHFILHTPLMWLDKAATWQLALDEGSADFVELLRTETHTCYLGERGEEHVWGYGCGECPACRLRAHGWKKFFVTTNFWTKNRNVSR